MPDDFAFAVKLPKAITHEARLIGAEEALDRFLEETGGLGTKRGPILIQLPPSLVFDAAVAADFLALLRDRATGGAAWEPRHRSWFTPEAHELLVRYRVARVAADPAPAAGADVPGGWAGLRYTRWHGSPQMYRSAYDRAELKRLGAGLRNTEVDHWAIFDNTMTGAATLNALSLREMTR